MTPEENAALTAFTNSELGIGKDSVRSSEWLDDMRRRVERAEDAMLNATTKREKEHAMIRYETVRDILSAYERKAAMSSNAQSSASTGTEGGSNAD